jgi:hypothetical protein
LAEFRLGWLPEIEEIRTPVVDIRPLKTSLDDFAYIKTSPRTKEDWFYPPLEPEFSAQGSNSEPLVYADWFALEATHELYFPSSDTADPELSNFLTVVLGMLKGLQLLPEGWGHFYRTPIKPGELVDFHPTIAAIQRVLPLAFDFWNRHPAVRTWIFGAIHWHLWGWSYQHPFENFGAQYAVLDTCWRIHQKVTGQSQRPSHSERILRLCEAYQLAVPSWAESDGSGSALSRIRNEYFHESLWGGKAVGLGHPQEHRGIHLELSWFNTRLVLALIGEDGPYVRSAIVYQPWLLE